MEEESESVGIMMMKINDEGKRMSGRTDNLEQASICTEWEQSSMVLNPCSQVGATVTTSDKTKAGVSSTSAPLVSPPPKQQSLPKSPAATMAGISSILQVGLNNPVRR